MSEFKRVSPEKLSGNFIDRIENKWALLTVTRPDGSYNTMTVSWGGIGYLWKRPVCFVFVRPQRYTHEFSESADRFTLSFFPDEHHDKLVYCGSVSGRDEDKVKNCGLTPVRTDGYTYFAEAEQVVAARKIYADELKEGGFLDPTVLGACYPHKDFHTVYVCEITGAVESV